MPTPLISFAFAGLVVLALLAGWTDVRTRRIPNALTVGATMAALVLRAMEGGLPMVAAGIGGLTIAFVLAFPLFALGVMGGGDVKLLAAVGAFLGTERIWVGLLVIAIAGGVVALVEAARKGAVLETLRHTARIPVRFLPAPFQSYLGGAPVRTLDTPDALTIPYGVPIGLGAVVAWFLTGAA